MPNVWSSSSCRPMGSAFHEMIALPTLAPELARPEFRAYGPGRDVQTPAPAGLDRETSLEIDGDADVQDAISVRDDSPEPDPDDKLFFVYSTMDYDERVSTGRSTKLVHKHATAQVPNKVAIIKFTRKGTVNTMLSVHDLQDRYVAGVNCGPPFKLYWAGSPGGKTNAPTVNTDAEWAILMDQLREARPSVKAVNIVFNIDGMQGHRATGAIGPEIADKAAELTFGTRVPQVDNFSNEHRAVAAKIEEINAFWDCALHGGHCYLDKDGNHIFLNRFRKGQFAAYLAATPTATALEPPPQHLLDSWSGAPVSATQGPSTTKPRGRSGPGSSSSSPISAPSNDTNTMLLSMMAPITAMCMQSMQASQKAPQTPSRGSKRRRDVSPETPTRAGSPPPAPKDELRACLVSFGKTKDIAPEDIARAIAGLAGCKYSPDSLDMPNVTRIMGLTGLEEGEAHQLQRFAVAWSARTEKKRARYNY
ncbi:hypothetical protein PENSPDRAFT_755088 [Peniophora sp. CONT]|nr:hypothetical protein PENSPDRAFT_755088 [Peniophora sp. CONT]